MTIPTRPAPPPPQNNTQQSIRGVANQNSNYDKIKITLPPPPSAKTNRDQNNFHISAASSDFLTRENPNNKSITRHFPAAKTRYTPATNWNGSCFGSEPPTDNGFEKNTKVPPPRPPPPKTTINTNQKTKLATNNEIVKSSRPPQSINVLSNLFGRRKSPSLLGNAPKLPPAKGPQLLNSHINLNNQSSATAFPEWPNSQNQHTYSSRSNTSPNAFESNDMQLISFDSPPNSPTLTQKSNSDCLSVDSFSSDSNFSSPHNGSASQPESGFEDDFSTSASTNSTQLTTPVDPWDILTEPITFIPASTTQMNYMHLNNMKNIDAHPIRNLHLIQKKNENLPTNSSVTRKVITPPSQKKLGMPTIIRPKLQKGLAPKPPGAAEISASKASQSSYASQKFQNVQNCDSQSSFEDDDPPMPNCPPPPPPSEILPDLNADIDYTNFDTSQCLGEPYAIALYDFDGIEDGDLSFRENDKIYLTSRLNDEWYMGRNRKGCEGILPASYIEIKISLEDKNDASPNATVRTENQALPSTSRDKTKNLVKVLYNFESSLPEDLTILENEMVHVLYRINEDWLFGRIENREGQFPANFIEKIPDNLTLKMP